MHSTKLTVTEMIRNFSEYINKIIYRREKFILLKGKKPAAELKPVPSSFSLGELQKTLSALPKLSDNEAADFLNDVKEIRNTAIKQPVSVKTIVLFPQY